MGDRPYLLDVWPGDKRGTFFSFNPVVHRKACDWQADRVLQSYPHENRAFNLRGHIHGIKVTHGFKRTLPRTRLLRLNPFVHLRTMRGFKIEILIGQERNVWRTKTDARIQSSSR